MLAHKTTTRATVKRYGVIVNPVADRPGTGLV